MFIILGEKFLKRLILSLMLFFALTQCVHAIGINKSAFYDKALLFSGTTFPQSTANDINNENTQKQQTLKTGMSATTNFLGLIEVGNASIDSAAKRANITKIHYVDTNVSKVYIPLLFIPIYAKTIRTTVYGE